MPSKRDRNGKWWHATVHNVTAIVGSGVLGLPTVMAHLGWEAGIVVLVMSWGITLYTLWQMVEMSELPGNNSGEVRRSRTYLELGQKALGEQLGKWVVLPLQLSVFIGGGIVYTITARQSLWLVIQLFSCKPDAIFDPVALGSGEQCCSGVGQWPLFVFYWLVQLLLAQLDGFNSIASFSSTASLMSICYCIIAAVASYKQGVKNHMRYAPVTPKEIMLLGKCTTSYHFPHFETTARQVSGVFSSLGVVWLLRTAATMWCLRFKKPCHVTGSYLVYSVPAFDIIETFVDHYRLLGCIENIFVNFGFPSPGRKRSAKVMQIVTRSIYVCFTTFVSTILPSFEYLLPVLGALASTPTTYFLPCIIWLQLKKPPAFTTQWMFNWFCIVIGALLVVVGSLGGLMQLIYIFKPDYSIFVSCNKPLSPPNCPNGTFYFHLQHS